MALFGREGGRDDCATGARVARVHTRDLQEARAWGASVFCDHELASLDAHTPVDARLCYQRLGGIGIGGISYGGEVTIHPSSFDSFYLIQVPLRGAERIEVTGQITDSSPSQGSVLNPQRPIRIRHRADTEKLFLRVDRDLLERQCGQQLGRGPSPAIEFDTAMSLSSSAGRRWAHTLRWLMDLVDQSGPDVDAMPPLLTSQIEQMVVTMLLNQQPSNVSGLLREDRRTVMPACVRRAESYIEEHAHEPITIGDIAEHVGVSSRSLYALFRRHRQTSPMLRLKEVRLRRVREQLQAAEPGRSTVTAVALHWGFAHLGHFTTDYKRAFGESPSQTLAR